MAAKLDKIIDTYPSKCPICYVSSDQSTLKSSAYIVTQKEQDGFVTQYNWHDKDFEKINPGFYEILTCPKCHYSHFSKEFLKIEKFSDFHNSYLQSYKEIRNESDIVFQKIVTFLSKNTVPSTERTIAQLLIMIQTISHMTPNPESNYIKGKLFLRVAWLFRSGITVNSDINLLLDNTYNLQTAFRENFDPLQTEFISFEQNVNKFQENILHTLHKFIDEENKDKVKELYKQIRILNTNLEKSTKLLHEQFEEISNIAFREKDHESFDNPEQTIDEFLHDLKQYWPLVPSSETFALKQVTVFLTRALNNGYFQDNLHEKTNTYKVITYSFQKLELYKEELDFLTQTLRTLFDEFKYKREKVSDLLSKRDSIQERIDKIKTQELSSTTVLKESLSEMDLTINKLKSEMNLLRDFSKQFKKLRIETQKKYLKKYVPKIEKALSKLEHVNSKIVTKLLAKNGFSHELIELYLKNYFGMEEESSPKKGLIGFLKGL
jgi:methyl-accepting chemotaxis protein